MTLDYAIRLDERPPDGWEATKLFAGWNPERHLGTDGKPIPMWEATNIVRVTLPAPLGLSFMRAQATRVAVHRKAAESLTAALMEIHDAGLWGFLDPFAGGYEFRRISGSTRLSLHSLGLAVDFDPAANPYRGNPDESRFGRSGEGRAVVRLFELYGWYWGGRFKDRPDAQHFQFATGC